MLIIGVEEGSTRGEERGVGSKNGWTRNVQVGCDVHALYMCMNVCHIPNSRYTVRTQVYEGKRTYIVHVYICRYLPTYT